MPVFEILQEAGGLWRARRRDGLVEGRFRDREGAVRFARREQADRQAVILFRT
ncbi:MAG: hypothetical protein JWP16_2639 [Alphaproteobacteria bacterium]|nr:hypothetical protein [Alphaproteobacteria bacterium]MDB5741599.1 hypothetical protein [Alphaproteobacteria bacterium]